MAQRVLNAESADIQHMRLAVTGQQCALLCAICIIRARNCLNLSFLLYIISLL